MAFIRDWNKNQNATDIATVKGATGTAASTTVDWDIIRLPQFWNEIAFQACIVACGSGSLNSICFKLLGGLDATNWVSLASITLSDTYNSGESCIRFISNAQVKYLKLSLSTVSYGAAANILSAASIRALVFANV